MAIWDMKQVRAVSQLRIEGWLAYEAIESAYINLQSLEVERMASRFVDEAHALAVEVEKIDLQLDMWRENNKSAMHYRIYWKPTTRVIELRGGPKDGELLEVQDIHNPVLVTENLPLFTEPLEPGPQAWMALEYKMAGWSEQKRHWVFDLVP